MRIIGCDLHARQQTLAMLDTITGEVVNRTLMHEGNQVREFYSELPRPVLVGIEAIGPMQWSGVAGRVGNRLPSWGRSLPVCRQLGQHLLYRFNNHHAASVTGLKGGTVAVRCCRRFCGGQVR